MSARARYFVRPYPMAPSSEPVVIYARSPEHAAAQFLRMSPEYAVPAQAPLADVAPWIDLDRTEEGFSLHDLSWEATAPEELPPPSTKFVYPKPEPQPARYWSPGELFLRS